MTRTRSRTALLASLVVAALVAMGAQAALSSPSLPEVPPAELVASALERAGDPLPMSGELTATLGLGLPVAPDEDSALADLLGESRLRVERSEDGVRAAVLGQRSERLVVSDGRELWTWDSRTLEATRTALPGGARPDGHGGDGAGADGPGLPDGLDPLAVATRALALAAGHAEVAADGTARVAGRAAYRLSLVPTDDGTTLGRVEVDLDADTRVPLRTALFARGVDAPPIEVAWTRLSFDPVDPAVFAFSPPPGATMVERPPSRHGAAGGPGPLAVLEQAARATGGVGPLLADGFASVAVLPLPAAEDGDGRLPPVDGPLLSVRVVEVDGQRILLAGLVPLSRLDEVATRLPASAP